MHKLIAIAVTAAAVSNNALTAVSANGNEYLVFYNKQIVTAGGMYADQQMTGAVYASRWFAE